ncbi:MAG TPA: hypothetical protein VER83_01460, partial [Candidatus Nanopelagicales bacterium]|nr:hypothetical protein [Candidatus Nanopelagicales bacterium]
ALDAIDPDGDPLTYVVVGGILPDDLVLNADGTWSGNATGGPRRFVVTVRACDPAGACADQVLSLVYAATPPDTSTEAPGDTGSPTHGNLLFVASIVAFALVLSWPRRRIIARPRLPGRHAS